MIELSVTRRQGAMTLDMAFSAGAGVTALFGPSGAGKTSIISMVAGLSRPDSGHISVDGRVLFDSAKGVNLPPEKRRLGVIFQEGRLFPHLTVRQNLLYGRRAAPPAERYMDLDQVVGLLGIETLLDRRPARLSGGEKQRVAIGRALLANPRILLMDEPLAALDAARKDEVLPFLAKLTESIAIPTLYVSHAMDEVLRLADTLVLIEAGKVAAAGPLEALLADPQITPLARQRDAGAVIPAVVRQHDTAFAATLLDSPAGQLRVRPLDVPEGRTVRVRLAAADIALALEPPKGVSVQNILPATVIGFEEAAEGRMHVALQAGEARLFARITPRARHDMGLRIGLPVFAMIKAVSMLRSGIAEHQKSRLAR